MPYAVHVEFRTASSFLVAYSVNLSRGGLFLETEAEIPTGTTMTLDFAVPSAGTTSLNGIVAWRRSTEQAMEGPPGIGIEFQDVAPQLGAMIDQLVTGFRGVQIMLMSGDKQDRANLARNIKSIISTAEITQAAVISVATTVLAPEIDLAIIDVDLDLNGSLTLIQAAKRMSPPVPVIALSSHAQHREHAVAAGADEVLANPPPFADLQVTLVRALSRPVAIRPLRNSGGIDIDR